MTFEVPSISDLNVASQRPTIAVDVGFGNSRSTSTGIAWSQSPSDSEAPTLITTDFGSCTDEILTLTERVAEFNLILEAPLFGAFDGGGNPVGRLPLEKQNGGVRYWYLQAGATVGLGASFLLRDLADRAEEATIHLFEGFVSFKEGPTKDEEDAKLLLSELREGNDGGTHNLEHSSRQEGAESCVSFLELLGFDETKHDLSCPLVVVAP
jgi:hypothetical protein